MTSTWRVLVFVFFGPAAVGAAQNVDDNVGAVEAAPAERQIRLARSQDGVVFQDAGLLLTRAGAPDVVALAGDRLLALFDYAPGESSPRTVICRSVSADGGRTWSRPEPIRFDRKEGIDSFAPALLVGPEGVLRLFFLSRQDHGEDAPRVSIRAGVSRDGLTFGLDAGPVVTLPAAAVAPGRFSGALLTAAVFDRRFHLFATFAINAGEGAAQEGLLTTLHYASVDGRRFDDPPQRVRSPMPLHGTIFAEHVPLRAYVADGENVVTLSSGDGRTWSREAGVRLAGCIDAAVAQVTSGGYIMLYVAAEPPPHADSAVIAMTDARVSRQIVESFARAAVAAPRTGQDATAAIPAVRTNEGPEQEEAAAPGASATGLSGGGPGDERLNERSEPPPFPMAPRPNFKEPVDYVAWHRSKMRTVTDNAFYAYAAFFPDELHPDTSPPDWPEGVNMFSDPDYSGPQGPWRPQEQPAWETTYQLYAGLREQYRQASLVPDYIQPPMFRDEVAESADDGRPLLMEMLLPNLSRHRTMAKELIASGWRVGDDGRVSADDMLETWRTTLRGANHLNSSVTLIEHLVALAEQGLVHRAARQALAHGVFEDKDLERGLDTLLEYDRGSVDPSRFLQGEYACAMDTIQYMFTPAGEDGRPRLNLERAERVMEWTEDGEMKESLANLQPQDAYATLDAFHAHYREVARMMERGYPEVRTSDLSAFEEKSIQSSVLQRVLTPSLSRVHTLRARYEASRRATQLSYAVHLFKAAHGRWPDSLDELPAEHGQRMRTDPFTGMNFGYRLDADGPTIYSLSENGLDDGGVHAPRWGDAPDETAGDDHVFWPPQD